MKARILIIGGGKKIIALIDTLRAIDGISLLGVCDADKTSEGFLYAKKLNLGTFTSITKSLSRVKPDIVIETSGFHKSREALCKAVDIKIKIIGPETAKLFLEVAEQKEKEVDRMKTELVSAMSHEFRTPLAAIKESVMLILDGTTGKISPEQNRFLNIARGNIDRLANTINTMLNLPKTGQKSERVKRWQREYY